MLRWRWRRIESGKQRTYAIDKIAMQRGASSPGLSRVQRLLFSASTCACPEAWRESVRSKRWSIQVTRPSATSVSIERSSSLARVRRQPSALRKRTGYAVTASSWAVPEPRPYVLRPVCDVWQPAGDASRCSLVRVRDRAIPAHRFAGRLALLLLGIGDRCLHSDCTGRIHCVHKGDKARCRPGFSYSARFRALNTDRRRVFHVLSSMDTACALAPASVPAPGWAVCPTRRCFHQQKLRPAPGCRSPAGPYTATLPTSCVD